MPKKKTSSKKSSKATTKTGRKLPKRKTATSRKTARKKSVKKTTKKKTAAKKKTASAKPPSRKPKKKTAAKPAKSKSPSLGRPRVKADANLEEFFKRDYEARQIFDFLHVQTVRELEEHTPEEIIERLTAPVVQTVDRIRKALALNNRCLAGDQKFAAEFKKAVKG